MTIRIHGIDSFDNEAPIARNSDPETSHRTARELTESGARDNQKQRVLAAVKRCPGLTSAELAYRNGLDRYTVARRLPDLKRDGLVSAGAAKVCVVTGKNTIAWKAR